MDDKFLYQNRPPVRQGFRESLYARIANNTVQKKAPNKVFKFALRFALACLFVFGLLFTFSEPVRANFLDWITKYIAGFEVQEVDNLHELPGYDEGTSFVLDHNSLTYALKDLPFEFSIPAHVPDGYVLVDKIEFDDSSVFLSWVNQDKEGIFMMVSRTNIPFAMIGTNSEEEIQINGQPALLVRGSYNTHDEWDPSLKRLSMYLIKDGLSYLISNNLFPLITMDMDTLEKELIRMAESIPDMHPFGETGEFHYTPQPVEEVIQNSPFLFSAPSYLPEGFKPHDGASNSGGWVNINWENENGDNINLTVHQDWRMIIPAGIETAEKERINTRSTLVIHGGYADDSGQVWDPNGKGIQLYWRVGGLIYILSGDTVSKAELIQIAESME